MNRELIKKEYEENQAKVISLFKWLKKSNNLSGINPESLFVKEVMPYIKRNNDSKPIYSLANLYNFPNLVNREMPENIRLFIADGTIYKCASLTYSIWSIAPSFKYVVIFAYAEHIEGISYFSWFWLYDSIREPFNPMKTIDRGKYGLSKVGKLYSFDESMEIIEALKDEWILSRI